ncbi:succinate dehydrogenase / fumarate reductase, flavoprotein subunit [Nitratiruptor sp. YY08-26]|uniref:FAD-dependent oxidoreductase n=1 Tax=unclassified Nitratiruptor TaxID=2624044 RepID=UPI001915426A|nr:MULTISPECIES: FAD-dependent oxidoreductase [unclassified Nitratiruptor]BCD61174.1 succinate dehydrogenase / fumarate reductase, flavoprotein subunit [Nitratiruptor sp. YY08-13]BCD65107.1 succinate dehydrogenase / fumarate reductase, flavoprotein subunit [Nitratiruptor sp. YY08-26]
MQIVIIGSGGAGLVAALEARSQGAEVVVVTKNYPTQAQTSMAQGGINAVLSENDSIKNHIEDTLRSAAGLGERRVIEFVCNEAPKAIKWLDSIGVPFSRKEEKIAQRRLGGASAPRACYAQDYTGLKILHSLYDNCIKAGVKFLHEKFLLNIITEDERAYGVTLLDIRTAKVEQLLASSIILATGGYAKIYGEFSTNGNGSFGEGVGAAMRAGAKLSDLEFVQFHPTALAKSSILISEAARGAGGKIINQNGERFVDELTTRDKLSRAIYEQIERGNQVFLDITHLGEDFIQKELPQERKLSLIYEGIDPAKEPVPIKPAAHYTMGGIDTDINCATNIKGLFAVGECANVKLHGANRLGGNSLLELVVMGRVAAKSAVQIKDKPQEKKYERTVIDEQFIKAVFGLPNKIDFMERKDFLHKVLYRNAGVFREELSLKGVLSLVRQHQKELAFMGIKDKSPLYNKELVQFLEYGNMLEITEAVLVGAIQRNESRGAHFRTDYPEQNSAFDAHTFIWKEDGVLCADFQKVPEEFK